MSLEAFVLRREMRRDLNRLESKVKLLQQQISDLIEQRAPVESATIGRESTRVAGHDQVLVDPAHSAR